MLPGGGEVETAFDVNQGEYENRKTISDSTTAKPSTDTTPTTSSDEEIALDTQETNSKQSRIDEDASINIRQQAWGKHGKVYLWIGIALMWTIFELDHTTIYNYQNYATSDFQEISLLGALTTAGTIVSAVLKPPIAKISDVAGRAETYCATVLLYIVSYVLCATARGFSQYAGGFIIYSIGQTGMQILNQIIVADITSSRWRGLANGLVNIPFMIIPWCSAFITDSALQTIGWRWGIGMFAIILPACSLAVMVPLYMFQRRMVRLGGTVHSKTSVYGFFSKIDFGGMVLLSGGCAMLLLPLALAGNTSDQWKTPWIPTLLAIGVVFLCLLCFYEAKIATHPVIPPRFLRNISLLLAWAIGLLDSFAWSVTHTYMYAWATVVHDFTARNATFLTYTAGCMQVVTGLITGYVMYKAKRYKFLLLIGVIIRLIGYGIMMRLRSANNPVWELFIVQVIQGAGSGVVGTVVIVVAEIVVPRSELAQSTALELLFIYLGNAIGSATAGGIYTNLFKDRLRLYLPSQVSRAQIDTIYDSITEGTASLSPQNRNAVNQAYSDVLRYMTIAALAASAIPMLMVWFLPNLKLSGKKHNLADALDGNKRNNRDEHENKNNGDMRREETRIQKWKRYTRW